MAWPRQRRRRLRRNLYRRLRLRDYWEAVARAAASLRHVRDIEFQACRLAPMRDWEDALDVCRWSAVDLKTARVDVGLCVDDLEDCVDLDDSEQAVRCLFRNIAGAVFATDVWWQVGNPRFASSLPTPPRPRDVEYDQYWDAVAQIAQSAVRRPLQHLQLLGIAADPDPTNRRIQTVYELALAHPIADEPYRALDCLRHSASQGHVVEIIWWRAETIDVISRAFGGGHTVFPQAMVNVYRAYEASFDLLSDLHLDAKYRRAGTAALAMDALKHAGLVYRSGIYGDPIVPAWQPARP